MAGVELALLSRNDEMAAANRTWLRERSVLSINVMSSPGSGKTTLLERTAIDLAGTQPVYVVEGDQETRLDADRIAATGAPVVQINTGAGCHLDARMLRSALDELRPGPDSVLFIENVGNLVCPALFDLGEDHRVLVMSATEGPDKPLKYPQMFASCDVLVLNKVDLLPHLDFDLEGFVDDVHRVRPGMRVLPLSATRGDGLEGWYAWLRHHRAPTGRIGPVERDERKVTVAERRGAGT
ncbi:MAG TPA: hydrogenase nickel incorporation protein HypB [Actinomycetales bacterium]|nr:hydrogenase nickel incorporation protein HypB [Actinomycetales bacterium]